MTLVGGTEFRVGGQRSQLARPLCSPPRCGRWATTAWCSTRPAARRKRGSDAPRRPRARAFRLPGDWQSGARRVRLSLHLDRTGTGGDGERQQRDHPRRAQYLSAGRGIPSVPGNREESGARNYYAGAWLTTPDGMFSYPLSKGGNAGFVIEKGKRSGNLKREFPAGSDFYLYDLGPGDRVYMVNIKQAVFRENR